MKKIVLSALAVAALGTVSATAGEMMFYKDSNGQVFTTPSEGRVAIKMEEASKVLTSAEEPKEKAQSGFSDRFHFKGDLRLRQEVIKNDGNIVKNRERYRFRYGMNVDIADDILFETATSSGKYNPTSGNVTFNNTTGGSTHDEIQNYFVDMLKIDILDVKYSFGDSWVRAGKSKHHIYRPIGTQLVWDNDIRLEGVNYGYKDSSTEIRVGINQIHREKGSKDGLYADDINMFIAQYVHKMKLNDTTKLNLGAAYYHYDGVKGASNPYGNSAGKYSVKGFKGNTYDTTNEVYLNDYGIAEVFAEVQVNDVLGKPLKGAVIVANNIAADNSNDTGYDLSLQYGKTKKQGDWQLNATYRKVEQDAVFGAHNDSDFSGGGTDSKGYFGKVKYQFAQNVIVQGWWNFSDTKISTGTPVEYYRHQLDVILKF